MMDPEYTAEQVSEALVDAVERKVPCSVTVGQITYKFNEQSEDPKEPLIVDSDDPEGMEKIAAAMSDVFVAENLRRAIVEAFPDAEEDLYAMPDDEIIARVRGVFGL